MRYFLFLGSLYISFVAAVAIDSSTAHLGWKAGWKPADTSKTDALAVNALVQLAKSQNAGHNQANCTLENAAVRKEWSTLLPSERKAYTDAVLCLQSKPSRYTALDPSLAPGAKTLFDDYIALHMNLTFSVHGTANFLVWHRLYMWTYEQDLKNTCGYKGYQPYWNWGKTAFDPINSPVFDGSPYSMSGNGVNTPHNCTNALRSTANPPVGCIPPGNGGGCVKTGPFKDYTVNLAPAAPTLAIPELNASLPFFSYYPRCMRRDISPWVSSQWTRDIDSYNLLTQNNDIYWFQQIMQGNGFPGGFYGVHAGGHYTIGGDPGGDFFISPGDPTFYLHHTQIDRMWWIWQSQNLASRLHAFSGTITFNDSPPSRNGTLDDWLDMGVVGAGKVTRDAMSTMAGEFCYIYV